MSICLFVLLSVMPLPAFLGRFPFVQSFCWQDPDPQNIKLPTKKFRIREIKHLSTHADSSTDAIGGWTRNTQNPIFLKTEKITKNAKAQKRLEI